MQAHQRSLSAPGSPELLPWVIERPRLRARVSPVLWMRWRLRSGHFERMLGAGVAVDCDAALALSAERLLAPKSRRRLATDLRRIVERAERLGSRQVISAALIDRGSVLQAREAILGLAERLAGEAPVSAQGVALARGLITDVRSPLFDSGCEKSPLEAIWAIQDALEARPVLGAD